MVLNNELEIKYCQSSEMVADALTKPLGTQVFVKLRKMMNTKPMDDKSVDPESVEQEGVLKKSVQTLSDTL